MVLTEGHCNRNKLLVFEFSLSFVPPDTLHYSMPLPWCNSSRPTSSYINSTPPLQLLQSLSWLLIPTPPPPQPSSKPTLPTFAPSFNDSPAPPHKNLSSLRDLSAKSPLGDPDSSYMNEDKTLENSRSLSTTVSDLLVSCLRRQDKGASPSARWWCRHRFRRWTCTEEGAHEHQWRKKKEPLQRKGFTCTRARLVRREDPNPNCWRCFLFVHLKIIRRRRLSNPNTGLVMYQMIIN